MHQSVPDGLPAVRHEDRTCCALAETRARSSCASTRDLPNAGVYDPPSIGGTHVIYVLHDITNPELYGGLPANPQIPATFTVWKRFAKPVGLLLALLAAPVAFFHYVTEGPKEPQPPAGACSDDGDVDERPLRRATADRSRARVAAASRVHAAAALGVAIFFILALLSGFAIYTPWLFRWLTPLFGGGPMTRLLHPWFSLVFVALFAAAVRATGWRPMAWTRADSRWLRHIRTYVTNSRELEPELRGLLQRRSEAVFLGDCRERGRLPRHAASRCGFPPRSAGSAVAISYVLHDIAALVMLVGFIVHIYEATAAQPGTFHSMTRGTVDERWAWTHHPAWYRRATGRDAKADYEAAVERQTVAARDSRAS